MEAVVQFLGIVAVTVGWLAALLAGGVHGIHSSTRIVKKGAVRKVGVRRTSTRVTRKSARPRHGKGPGKTTGLQNQPSHGKGTVYSTPNSSPAVSACPSCGLVAPDELMVEHFAGSPSHEKGTARDEPKQAVSEAKSSNAAQSDDTSTTLRNIIRILIPPRAFGRRHWEKTENPLSKIVHELDAARKTPVGPLAPEVELFETRPEAIVRNVPDSGASQVRV